MTVYELNFAQDRQAAVMEEIMREQLLREARSGQPTTSQRLAVAVGGALESAGGWLKARGNASRGYTGMNQGLSVSR